MATKKIARIILVATLLITPMDLAAGNKSWSSSTKVGLLSIGGSLVIGSAAGGLTYYFYKKAKELDGTKSAELLALQKNYQLAAWLCGTLAVGTALTGSSYGLYKILKKKELVETGKPKPRKKKTKDIPDAPEFNQEEFDNLYQRHKRLKIANYLEPSSSRNIINKISYVPFTKPTTPDDPEEPGETDNPNPAPTAETIVFVSPGEEVSEETDNLNPIFIDPDLVIEIPAPAPQVPNNPEPVLTPATNPKIDVTNPNFRMFFKRRKRKKKKKTKPKVPQTSDHAPVFQKIDLPPVEAPSPTPNPEPDPEARGESETEPDPSIDSGFFDREGSIETVSEATNNLESAPTPATVVLFKRKRKTSSYGTLEYGTLETDGLGGAGDFESDSEDEEDETAVWTDTEGEEDDPEPAPQPEPAPEAPENDSEDDDSDDDSHWTGSEFEDEEEPTPENSENLSEVTNSSQFGEPQETTIVDTTTIAKIVKENSETNLLIINPNVPSMSEVGNDSQNSELSELPEFGEPEPTDILGPPVVIAKENSDGEFIVNQDVLSMSENDDAEPAAPQNAPILPQNNDLEDPSGADSSWIILDEPHETTEPEQPEQPEQPDEPGNQNITQEEQQLLDQFEQEVIAQNKFNKDF